MLNVDSLTAVLDAATQNGMSIEYVETNSSWYRDDITTVKILSRLKKHGLHTLLVSISPFHNEYIPFRKIEGVIAAARNTGIGIFPWIERFVPELSALDRLRTHKLEAFEAIYGRDYLETVLDRYWVHPGGRALTILRAVRRQNSIEQILEEEGSSCAANLSDTTHFHIDLFGNYIPGLCTGLAIQHEDLGRPFEPDRYPLLNRLYRGGVRACYDWVSQEFGFKPEQEIYHNKCDLCTEIRTHLARNFSYAFSELRPMEFYMNSNQIKHT
jgi:hypothetical protein